MYKYKEGKAGRGFASSRMAESERDTGPSFPHWQPERALTYPAAARNGPLGQQEARIPLADQPVAFPNRVDDDGGGA
jgi:hypothetical protein